MRLLIATALLTLATVALPAEDELDIDLMQSIEDTNRSLASNIAVKAGPPAVADAHALNEMFGHVEDFYQRKGDAPDAVELARKSRALAQRIQAQLAAPDFEAATDTATQLSRTCKTCHSFYKKS